MILAGFDGTRAARYPNDSGRKPQACSILIHETNRRAMPTSAETLEYIASLVKELAEMSDDLGRPTLSYLLRMAVMEAEGGAAAFPNGNN
jgi:hypothetical protein